MRGRLHPEAPPLRFPGGVHTVSLRFKLFGAIGAILCVVLGVVVTLTLIQEQQRAAQVRALEGTVLTFAASLASPAELVRTSALVRGESETHPAVRGVAIFERGPAEPRITREWGRVLASDTWAKVGPTLVAEAFLTGRAQRAAGGLAQAIPTRPPGDSAPPAERVSKVVWVELRATTGTDPVRVSRLQFVLIVGAGVVLLLTAWWILERVVVRPLREIEAAAARVAVGDYGTPVPQSGGDDEMQRVIGSFNRMMVDLDDLQGRLKGEVGDALARARQTQDSLVVAQRLAATGRLAAGIAHEVNNPLAGLLNAVHSLRTKDMPPAKREEYLELIDEGLRRIQATVAKILQFRPHKVAPRPVAVDEIVRPVLGLARHRLEKLGVAAVVEGDGAVRVFGDPYELQQALLNIVLNALDATEEAGRPSPRLTIQVLTAESAAGGSGVGRDVAPGEVQIVVRDDGTGMKDEDVARAFDLFFTTKEPGKGTGLGLAMVHKIVTDHGGRIRLQSRGAEGLDVEITLPRFGGAEA